MWTANNHDGPQKNVWEGNCSKKRGTHTSLSTEFRNAHPYPLCLRGWGYDLVWSCNLCRSGRLGPHTSHFKLYTQMMPLSYHSLNKQPEPENRPILEASSLSTPTPMNGRVCLILSLLEERSMSVTLHPPFDDPIASKKIWVRGLSSYLWPLWR